MYIHEGHTLYCIHTCKITDYYIYIIIYIYNLHSDPPLSVDFFSSLTVVPSSQGFLAFTKNCQWTRWKFVSNIYPYFQINYLYINGSSVSNFQLIFFDMSTCKLEIGFPVFNSWISPFSHSMVVVVTCFFFSDSSTDSTRSTWGSKWIWPGRQRIRQAQSPTGR